MDTRHALKWHMLAAARTAARPARMLTRFVLLLLALFVSLAPPAVLPTRVQAAAMVVNTLDGDGLADGFCSLPEAILNANQNIASAADCPAGSGEVPDVITFSVSGVIVIPSNLYIFDGAGLVIDGAGRAVTVTGTRPDGVVTPLFVQSSAEFRNLTIANSTGRGATNQGVLLLDRVTVSGNQLGGVSNAGTLTIRSSTLTANTGELGAGLYNASTGIAVVANATISGNTATVEGGGVQNVGNLSLINVTIAGNSAPVGGGVGGPAFMTNSVLANAAPLGPDCSGAVIFTGPNILTSLTGCGHSGDAPLVGAPLLGALAANGGATQTHALLPGSPARDVGLALVCAAAPVNGVDQRGISRPQGAGCDLGAYEAEVAVPGGRNLRIGTGPIELWWDGGTLQTGYTLLKYNTSTAAATLIALPGNATSYSDTTAANGVVYCYALAATGGTGFLGLSDLECALAGLQAGTVVPGAFRLALNQTATATLTWTPPSGGADAYLLVVIPLDGSPDSSVSLGGSAVSATHAVVPAGTCFQLTAFKGTAFGLTDVVCGMPGVTTFAASGNPLGAGSGLRLLEQLAQRVGGHLIAR